MALTTGERSALKWLTAVALLGSGAKLYRNWRNSDDASPVSTEALSRQLVAVDSAQRAGRRSGRSGRGGGVAGSGGGARRSGRRNRSADGADSTAPASGGWGSSANAARPVVSGHSAARTKTGQLPTLGPVDLDRADSAALERLPRIGPALAARIVADRSANGSYGSLEGLQRVRGIGPKLAKSLETLVTFSGISRPSPVQR